MVNIKNETELPCLIGSSVIYDETRQDIDMTNHTDEFYTENEIELFELIKSGAVCDKN